MRRSAVGGRQHGQPFFFLLLNSRLRRRAEAVALGGDREKAHAPVRRVGVALDVPAGAPLIDRIVAVLGRPPGWAAGPVQRDSNYIS